MNVPLILPPLRRHSGDAEAYASVVHAGQTDKGGAPYIGHLARVVGRTSAKIPGLNGTFSPERLDEMLQIAWLHDVIEDTSFGTADLAREGFSEGVLQGVYALSNVSGVPYCDFIAGIAEHAPLAVILVKLSDNEDNADPERLAKLDVPTQKRLLTKYEPSIAMLRDAAQSKGWTG